MENDVELRDRWRAGETAAGQMLLARHFDSLCANKVYTEHGLAPVDAVIPIAHCVAFGIR